MKNVSTVSHTNIKMLYTDVFSFYDDEMLQYSYTETNKFPAHINQDHFKPHMQFQVRDIKQNQSCASLTQSQ